MQSLMRWSAAWARCSSRTRASSTYSRRPTNASSSSAEWAMRSRVPSPRTALCERRRPRSLNARTIARMRAIRAAPAAARATMPCVVVRSSTRVRLTGASGGLRLTNCGDEGLRDRAGGLIRPRLCRRFLLYPSYGGVIQDAYGELRGGEDCLVALLVVVELLLARHALHGHRDRHRAACRRQARQRD